MKFSLSSFIIAILLLACVCEGIAIAAPGTAEAQALFEEGKRLVAAGRIEEGCTRLEESQRISPAGGTVLHLAACRETQGKLATAWELFNAALSEARRAGRKDREEVAAQRIASIEPRLTRIRVVVPPPSKIANLTVRRDDVDLDPAAWGLAIPVDPGDHELVARAPNHATWTSRIRASTPGATMDVVIPLLANEAPSPSSTSSKIADTKKDDAGATSGGLSNRRIGALVAAGVGLVGVSVGTYFYFDSVAKKTSADDLCGGPAPTPCPEEGISKAEDATAAGNIATAAFGLGIAGLALGAALWFLDPASTTTVSTSGRRLVVRF